jgi:hypothetical protein
VSLTVMVNVGAELCRLYPGILFEPELVVVAAADCPVPVVITKPDQIPPVRGWQGLLKSASATEWFYSSTSANAINVRSSQTRIQWYPP